MLHVQSAYKRRGVATLITKTMAKKLADLDMDTYAPVILDNVASRCLFEKIGFKIVDYSHILRTHPLVASDWNDEDST